MAAIRNPAAFAAWQARQQQAQQDAIAQQQAQQMAMIAAMQQQAAPVQRESSTPLGAFATVFAGEGGTAAQRLWGNDESPTQMLWGEKNEPEIPGQPPSKKKNRSWGNVNSAVFDLWER